MPFVFGPKNGVRIVLKKTIGQQSFCHALPSEHCLHHTVLRQTKTSKKM